MELNRIFTTWISHGELTHMQRGPQTELIDIKMGDRLEDMIRDIGQEFI